MLRAPRKTWPRSRRRQLLQRRSVPAFARRLRLVWPVLALALARRLLAGALLARQALVLVRLRLLGQGLLVLLVLLVRRRS